MYVGFMVQGKSFLYFKLEHWPKLNTDTNVNFFLGGQNMCVRYTV